jgi:serine/threonine protein kinase
VFELAIKLRPEDQDRFLERECRGDRALLEELKSLVSAYRESGISESGSDPAQEALNAPPMPQRIGRYEITGSIGSGGFGRVYSARDPAVGRVIAIKILSAPGDRDLVKRFRSEAVTVANLHHKNIVTVHEFGEENGVPYLVMEYLEGTNLHDLIRQRTPLSLQEKLSIMSEVAEGLRCAHDRGVIHRDVKPANIMRLTDGSVKIMDFGIARLARSSATRLTHTGLVIGTLMYMAPEQFSGTADALTDIFAYGVTFYELLTGRHPFSFSEDPAVMMHRIMSVEPEAVRALFPECPESVERIVSRTLAKNREARYTSLADVVADTKPILQDLGRQQAGELFSRAQDLLHGDQLDAAQSTIRKALELDPWHADARLLRSSIEEALHRRDLLGRAGALLDRSEGWLREREYAKAEECLATVKQMALSDVSVNARLEKAYGLIEQARNAQLLLESARQHLRKENLTEAFRTVSQVLAMDPGNSEGQHLLEEVRTRMASREAQRKIQEEMGRAESLLSIGEIDQALVLLIELESRDPSNKELSALRIRADSQTAEAERARRLAGGIAAVRDLLRNRRFDDALGRIDGLLAEFPDHPELKALHRFAAEQVATRKRSEEIRQLKADAAAWIESGEYDRALRALEAGVAAFGEDGDLTRLLQAAVAGKVGLERERAIARIVEDTERLRAQGKLDDDALRAIERAIKPWGHDPRLDRLLQEVSGELREKERHSRIRDVLQRANTLIDQDNPDAAILLLRQSVERDGEDREITRLLKSAESHIRARSRSARLSVLLEEVKNLAAEQRWEQARHRIDEALAEYPNEPSLVAARAAVLPFLAVRSTSSTWLGGLSSNLASIRHRFVTRASVPALTVLAAIMLMCGFWVLHVYDTGFSRPQPRVEKAVQSQITERVAPKIEEGAKPQPSNQPQAIPGQTPQKKGAEVDQHAKGSGGLTQKGVAPGAVHKGTPACSASKFVLAEYGDLRAGEIVWTGALGQGNRLFIGGEPVLDVSSGHVQESLFKIFEEKYQEPVLDVSSGHVQGDVPPIGIPVRFQISPNTVRITSGPSAGNCWRSGLYLENTGSTANELKIRWEVFQP